MMSYRAKHFRQVLSFCFAFALILTLVLPPNAISEGSDLSGVSESNANTANSQSDKDRADLPNKASKPITPQATTEYYIDIPQHIGSYDITGTMT